MIPSWPAPERRPPAPAPAPPQPSPSRHARGMRLPLRRRRLSVAALPPTCAGENCLPMTMLERNVIYTVSVMINSITFNLMVDTGSSDIWVACEHLHGRNAPICHTPCPLNASIEYASATVCVLPETVPFQVGHLRFPKYTLGIGMGSDVVPSPANNFSAVLVEGAHGLLGLGYHNLTVLDSASGLLVDRLHNFTLYMRPDDPTIAPFLMFNDVPDELVARDRLDAVRVPLRQTHKWWSVGMTAFQAGDSISSRPCIATNKDGSCHAILDSGTSFVLMPPTVYDCFVETYLSPAGCVPHQTRPDLLVCRDDIELPPLGFTFAAHTFWLERKDYLRSVGARRSVVELQRVPPAVDMNDTWVLGGTFLKRFLSTFVVNDSIILHCQDSVTCRTQQNSINSTSFWRQCPTTRALYTEAVDDIERTRATRVPGHKKSTAVPIILGVLAGIGLLLAVAGIVFLRRHRQSARKQPQRRPALAVMASSSDDHSYVTVDTILSPHAAASSRSEQALLTSGAQPATSMARPSALE
ncbi:hypothetical protein PINS_up014806 [Pythium insidiosum]|nr:hypothetical protein PINS_up014806 [Pythium insidiosum]